MYVWPNQRETIVALRESAKRGFNVVSWSGRDFTYFAVSDVHAGELRELVGYLGAS